MAKKKEDYKWLIVLGIILLFLFACIFSYWIGSSRGFDRGYSSNLKDLEQTRQENNVLKGKLDNLNSTYSDCILNLNECEKEPKVIYDSDDYYLPGLGEFSLDYHEIEIILKTYVLSLLFSLLLSFSLFKINIKIEGRVLLWFLLILSVFITLIILFSYGG
ncbi:MAG: hypothetical protein WCX73_02835 [Candidatus Pacearchaeota archaeon]|jgi:hypothetical protein